MKHDDWSTIPLQQRKSYAFYLRKKEPSRFLVGQVLQQDDRKELLLRLIAPDGTADGFLLFPIACAYRIEQDSQYLHPLEQTATQHDAMLQPEETAWNTLLSYAKEQRVAVQLRDREWKRLSSGFVTNFTAHNIVVQRIRKNGEIGQSRSYGKNRVAFLFCGSESEVSLMHQYQEAQHERSHDPAGLRKDPAIPHQSK